MKTPGLSLYALLACCVAVAACSPSTELSRFQYAPSINNVRDFGAGPMRYRVLHSFGAPHDGSRPNDLIRVGDALYGTTLGGGTQYCVNYGGCGTVFSITGDGTEKVLHNFGKGKDGSNPAAGLIDVGGTLYGTTEFGGAHGYGTVFSIAPGSKEKVLYSFGARPDGQSPSADLVDVDGTLYGTTFGGGLGCGTEGCGTVFRVTVDGKERVLHRFDNATNKDGWYPDAGLTDVGGTLYGTTLEGGLYGSYGNWGTFFSMTRGGTEKILHNFGKGNDGWYPAADLLDVNGTLYGTTIGGGSHNCPGGYGGCGTVFSITTDGKEKVLHDFHGIDGSYPAASLIDAGGTLYGTTKNGGTNSCGPYGRCGTVFSITRSGVEKVPHIFRGETGYLPEARLIYMSGSFFGTTQLGGRYGGGPPYSGGVVFSLTP
jgi:uncharacterized repeat protein (TIGR03803 family)